MEQLKRSPVLSFKITSLVWTTSMAFAKTNQTFMGINPWMFGKQRLFTLFALIHQFSIQNSKFKIQSHILFCFNLLKIRLKRGSFRKDLNPLHQGLALMAKNWVGTIRQDQRQKKLWRDSLANLTSPYTICRSILAVNCSVGDFRDYNPTFLRPFLKLLTECLLLLLDFQFSHCTCGIQV